jgi:hypothetical protein
MVRQGAQEDVVKRARKRILLEEMSRIVSWKCGGVRRGERTRFCRDRVGVEVKVRDMWRERVVRGVEDSIRIVVDGSFILRYVYVSM